MSSRKLVRSNALCLAIGCLITLEVAAQTKQPRGRQTAKTPAATLDREAKSVADNYWGKRFTRCGEITLWGVRRPVGSRRTATSEDLVLFASKDQPIIVTEDAPPTDKDSQRMEWNGRSRISIKTAQDFNSATYPTQRTLKQNLQYAVTIQRTQGVWEAVEDQSDEKLVQQPLFEDINSGWQLLLESCLRFGGDPNLRNDSGDTLLMTAASAGNGYAVAELLNKNADVNLKNRNGWTASYLARLQKHEAVVELLDTANAVCEGPIKSVCQRFPPARVDDSLLTPDPRLMAPVRPDPLLTAPDRPNPKPDNSTKVIFFGVPQPEYTEEARRNKITGTVVLRIVFLASGEVGNIRVVAGLPYGLTERAIEAARKIKFTPAMLDGRAIDKEKQVEFNFALP